MDSEDKLYGIKPQSYHDLIKEKLKKQMDEILKAQEQISLPKIFISSNTSNNTPGIQTLYPLYPKEYPHDREYKNDLAKEKLGDIYPIIFTDQQDDRIYSSILNKYINPNTGEPIEY